MNIKVGILCPGDEEVYPYIPIVENMTISEKAMLKFYEGKIEGIDVVTLFCGTCKVNAAIATQILIDTYGVNIIIVSGVAGGLSNKLKIGDTIISTEVTYHDVAEDILAEFHPWLNNVYFKADESLLNIIKESINDSKFKQKIYYGRIVTGENFITQEGRDKIIQKYDPLCVDMETASVAHVCYVNKIPYIAVRSISDTEDESGLDVFEVNCSKASINSKNVVVSLLKKIKKSDTMPYKIL